MRHLNEQIDREAATITAAADVAAGAKQRLTYDLSRLARRPTALFTTALAGYAFGHLAGIVSTATLKSVQHFLASELVVRALLPLRDATLFKDGGQENHDHNASAKTSATRMRPAPQNPSPPPEVSDTSPHPL